MGVLGSEILTRWYDRAQLIFLLSAVLTYFVHSEPQVKTEAGKERACLGSQGYEIKPWLLSRDLCRSSHTALRGACGFIWKENKWHFLKHLSSTVGLKLG